MSGGDGIPTNGKKGGPGRRREGYDSAGGLYVQIPRMVIAGTQSGCGKTTIASGIMAALVSRGLRVQPFKIGPDFIDPTHHSQICSRPSRNLDPYMMGEDGVRETFERASRGADIAVIEGVMGLYDGMDGTETSSTAHVAKILKAPVFLVIDARGMSRSLHAVVQGYRGFDREVQIAGIIVNRVGSPRHRGSIEAGLQIMALGWIPRTADLEIGSRHLGLEMAHETPRMRGFGRLIEETCDLDAMIGIATAAGPLPEVLASDMTNAARVTIGIARDEAFCFYYQDNLERLAAAGAKLVFFSLIRDRLPELDCIYLGGGYPELHAGALEASPCIADLRRAADDGMPVYAECGGLIALTERMIADREYRLAGVLPAHALMEGRIQGLGYVEARVTGGPGVLTSGLVYRGHEFHYSRIECQGDARFAITLNRGRGIADGRDGLYAHNAMGCYTHAYFPPRFAASLVDAASRYRRR